jgi:hypothetical protein
MRKSIRILEVPLLLLAVAFGTYIEGNTIFASCLIAVSIIRLVVNHITDDSVYKN